MLSLESKDEHAREACALLVFNITERVPICYHSIDNGDGIPVHDSRREG